MEKTGGITTLQEILRFFIFLLRIDKETVEIVIWYIFINKPSRVMWMSDA